MAISLRIVLFAALALVADAFLAPTLTPARSGLPRQVAATRAARPGALRLRAAGNRVNVQRPQPQKLSGGTTPQARSSVALDAVSSWQILCPQIRCIPLVQCHVGVDSHRSALRHHLRASRCAPHVW